MAILATAAVILPLARRNRLLRALPAGELRRLLPRLESVSLRLGQVLCEPGAPVRHVYFPAGSLVSLLAGVDARRSLEVGMVGAEGMAGLSLALGGPRSTARALVQGAGPALRIAAGPFRLALARSPALRRALLLEVDALLAQVAQGAACNRFHRIPQRLARWLLMTRDRVGADEFAFTQDFIAHMLGVRRVGVTAAAGALRRRGLISYVRGRLRVLDGPGLERAACSCYRPLRLPTAAAGRAARS